MPPIVAYLFRFQFACSSCTARWILYTVPHRLSLSEDEMDCQKDFQNGEVGSKILGAQTAFNIQATFLYSCKYVTYAVLNALHNLQSKKA